MDEADSRLPWAWILGLTLLAYLPVFGAKLNFDDVLTVTTNEHIASWSVILAGVRDIFGRPLFWATLKLDFALWGREPAGYHATSLALHLAATALLAALARDLSGRRAGIAAGLLFGLHPLASSAVCYVSARSEVLAAVFCLLALRALLAGRPAWAAAAWLLALLSKESAIALPACVLALSPLLPPHRRPAARLWALAGCALALLAFSRLGPRIQLPAGRPSAGAYLQAGIGALGHYARLWILPFGQAADPDAAPSALPAVLALPAALLALWRVSGRAACAFLAALLAVAPSSSVLILLDPVAEHRAYLACAFLALGAAPLLPSLPRLGALALLAGLLTASRADAWRSETGLWHRDLRTFPRKSRIYENLTIRYGQAASATRSASLFDAAERKVRQAMRLGELPGHHFDLAMIALDRHDGRRARAHLLRAIEMNPEQPRYRAVLRRLEQAGFR